MLEKEIKIFDENLASFLKERKGQFVVIKDEEINFFQNGKDAIENGLRKYGATTPFLVRQVVEYQLKVEIPALYLGLLNAHI